MAIVFIACLCERGLNFDYVARLLWNGDPIILELNRNKISKLIPIAMLFS